MRQLEWGAAAAVAGLAMAAGALWSSKGLAVYLEAVASRMMTCF